MLPPRQHAVQSELVLRDGYVPNASLPLITPTIAPHPPLIVGLDGSLTAYGCGLVTLEATPRVLRAICISTKPDAKSTHRYQADADGARVDEIAKGVLDFIRSALALTSSIVIVIEAPAGAQHANAAKALGLSYGISRTACVALGIAPITVQAHEVKKEIGGSMGASKDDVAAGVMRLAGWTSKAGTKPAREAEHDAVGIALTGAKSPVADALRRAWTP